MEQIGTLGVSRLRGAGRRFQQAVPQQAVPPGAGSPRGEEVLFEMAEGGEFTAAAGAGEGGGDEVILRSARRAPTARAGRPAATRAPAALIAPVDRRRKWLSDNLARERAGAAVAEATARVGSATQGETLATLARERILGSNDLVDMNYLEMAVAVARGICRIRIGTAAGTGSLVGPGVLMTNHHVLRNSDEARHAVAQFDYQENLSGELLPVQAYALDPGALFITDELLDFTLVGVAPVSNRSRPLLDYPWTKLIGSTGKAEKGDAVNIIQHPRGGLKQIALRNNQVIEIPQNRADFLYYTTDTEPGSSGSPCFNDQWELIALHHSGVPAVRGNDVLKKDGTPWRDGVDDPALIHWIANEGVRISAIVSFLRSASAAGSGGEAVARLLQESAPNPVELARRRSGTREEVATPPNVRPSADGRVLTFTAPLTITLSLGSLDVPGRTDTAPRALAPPAVSVPGLGPQDAAETVVIDPDWSAREGYRADFLDTEVPLPRLSDAVAQAACVVPEDYRRSDGDAHVLDYHHYSVVMHQERRFALYSAAMVDGDRRFKLPPRKDKWFIDPRIDDAAGPQVQCGEELYATSHTDRGHLTRYLDVAWGDTLEEAQRSVNDTFHFTNCTLQLSDFNQSQSRWQGIERYLLEQKARKEKRRMVVITGPLFTETDPRYRNQYMNYSVRIPLQFWKVCALIRQDGTLSATGFVLGQEDIAELPGFEEAFDVTVAQVRLQDLEQRTGLLFGVLTEADHFAAGGAPGSLELDRGKAGKRRMLPIRDVTDIVV